MQIGDEFIWCFSKDIIEVKLMTSDYKTYFKGSAPIKDRKKLRQLLNDLENKGVIFHKGWFD